MRMEHDNWSDLIIEQAARPLPLPEDRFRAWMNGQHIFVSSTMDAEMTPFRQAVRGWLQSWGAMPMMWESITPQDKGPQRAYLDGVDQSTFLLLLLGSRYGVTDESGYSPTHQEANRAAEQKIPRLLFTLSTVKPSDRDGRLNDWLNSLYRELSGASFATSEDVIAQLESQMRDLAARSERMWIKLGNLIFPGKVASQPRSSGNRSFTITARVTTGRVRQSLLSLGQHFGNHGVRADRLTWADHSFPVQFESVTSETDFASQSEVEVKCRIPSNWYGDGGDTMTMISYGGRSQGPEDLAVIWAKRAFFGEDGGGPRGELDMAYHSTEPASKPLPLVLREANASGWLAEGIVKLYIAEEIKQRYGGNIEHLQVGPATAVGIRVEGVFTLGGGMSSRNAIVNIQGVVPLR
jgi:Domain of unknown function (DUF4062)